MFEPFAEVPLYPLVFPVFWGAAAFFVLAMARHLRVFAAARNASPTDRPLARLVGHGPLRASSRSGCSATSAPGSCTPAIFWGFVLLTVGTANIVTGGLIQAIVSIPLDGCAVAAVIAMQNVVAVIVLVCVALGVSGAGVVVRPRPPDAQSRDALDDPAADRRRRR